MYNPNKTTYTKKAALILKKETRFTREYFFGGRIFSGKCSKSSVFTKSVSLNSDQFIFISKGAAFCMHVFTT